MIYLDHSATTPLAPEARSAMDAAMAALAEGVWANPSSQHTPGRRARAALNDARAHVASALGAAPGEIVFTGSASEANNLALKGAVFAAAGEPFHLFVSAIEHDCVIETARWLAARFPYVRLMEIPPDGDGIVQPDALDAAMREAFAATPPPAAARALVSVLMVHNETGVRQPVEALAPVARSRGALFHVDAVQAFGRETIRAADLGCDLLSVSAHKIYGPRGVGGLIVRRGLKLDSLVHGGRQEAGRRAGTESLELIAGFAAAAQLADSNVDANRAKLAELDRIFLTELRALGTPFEMNGPELARAPGILNISLPGAQSHDLVIGMDLAGFAISAGSACSSGVIEPSRSLKAMDLPPARVGSAIRISFGRSNTPEHARAAAAALHGARERLARESLAADELVL